MQLNGEYNSQYNNYQDIHNTYADQYKTPNEMNNSNSL